MFVARRPSPPSRLVAVGGAGWNCCVDSWNEETRIGWRRTVSEQPQTQGKTKNTTTAPSPPPRSCWCPPPNPETRIQQQVLPLRTKTFTQDLPLHIQEPWRRSQRPHAEGIFKPRRELSRLEFVFLHQKLLAFEVQVPHSGQRRLNCVFEKAVVQHLRETRGPWIFGCDQPKLEKAEKSRASFFFRRRE